MDITTFPKNTASKKASLYFTKLCNELNLDKYKLDKYKELFDLTSFQNMHDSDLAYHHVYSKCAESADSKQALLRCLDFELKSVIRNPGAFNIHTYKLHIHSIVNDIAQQLNSGSLDYLFN